MMSIRVKTGISGLDKLLQGGLRPGSFNIITGPIMSGKEIFAQEFFYRGLEADECCIYIATKNFADEIISSMEERGWFLSKYNEKYVFIDTYSTQSDPSLKDTDNIKYVPSVADFAKLSNTIVTSMSQFLAEGCYQQRIIFDNVDTMLMYVSPPGVFRFLSYIRAKIKSFKACGAFLLQTDIHDEKDVKTLTQLADAILDFSPTNNEITVQLMGSAKSGGKYEISNEGLIVEL